MLDTRCYREDPKNENASMLGQVQKKWLLDKLKSPEGKFNVLASSVPWAKANPTQL
jgi:phosphodiesterase/alkaline phosphatase D-like protein